MSLYGILMIYPELKMILNSGSSDGSGGSGGGNSGSTTGCSSSGGHFSGTAAIPEIIMLA